MSKFRNFEKYEVYPDGRIWSYKSKKFLKPITDKGGYQVVMLYDNEGKGKMYKLHRVVWEAVTGEPIPKYMQINHRSEAKYENFFENLELVTPKENCNYGSRNERVAKKRSKQVGAFKDGELFITLKSTQEAQRQGFNSGHIVECCNGKRKTHKGFEWRYL